MNGIPLHKRPYDVFISYSHADTATAEALEAFLARAGFAVWRDIKEQGAGADLIELPSAIGRSRAFLLLVSEASAKSKWVPREYKAAIAHQDAYPGFRIIPVRIDETMPPPLLETAVWLDFSGSTLTGEGALSLLTALRSSDRSPPARDSRDVYTSYGWRPAEQDRVRDVLRPFARQQYRLIGDTRSHPTLGDDARVPTLIRSCGALVAVAPDRGGTTSPFILNEVECARGSSVPYLILKDDAVEIPADLVDHAIERRAFSVEQVRAEPDLQAELVAILDEHFDSSRPPHYTFFAGSLSRPEVSGLVERTIEAVTGLRCLVGARLAGEHAQLEIIDRISRAAFVLADITGDSKNTLIEAGIARGAHTRLFLVAEGEPAPTRFMFRDLEIGFYSTESELLASVSSMAMPYERLVLNEELSREV